MRKIILLSILCTLVLFTSAQNYNGYYTNPNTNDILYNTAISNVVPGYPNKILIIDTYLDVSNMDNYLILNFVDDYFIPIPNTTKRIPCPNHRMGINDVKYDPIEDCYVACGWTWLNSTTNNGLIMRISSTGNIDWTNTAWDDSQGLGANEYRRVAVINSPAGNSYATCGWGTNPYYSTTNGVISFYDKTTGALTYNNLSGGYNMYTPISITNAEFNTFYTDLVYDPITYTLNMVGKFDDILWPPLNTNVGYLREQFDLSTGNIIPQQIIFTKTPTAIKGYLSITVDNNYDVKARAVYIAGTFNNSTSIYVAKINETNFYNILQERSFQSNPDFFFEVNDMCFNPHPNIIISGSTSSQLGIVGKLKFDQNANNGYLLQLNTDNLSISFPGFLAWDINNGYSESFFDHIVYRDNNYSAITYSYILYGEFTISPFNRSLIDEYYPSLAYCHEGDWNHPIIEVHGTYLSDSPTEPLDIENTKPNDWIYYDINVPLNYICNPPNYLSTAPEMGDKSKLLNSQLNYSIEERNIRLNDFYKQAICNVYTIEGKLLFTKQSGVSTIPTQDLTPGIYFLQPVNNNTLKSFKFNIVH